MAAAGLKPGRLPFSCGSRPAGPGCDLVAEIRALPLTDRQAFFADRRNIWTAES